MTPSPDATADPALAVVVARLDDLRADVASLRTELKDRDLLYLPRAEFEAWRTGIGRELGDIKAAAATAQQSAEAKRAPWWAVAAVLIAAIGALVTVVPILAQGVGG